MYALRAMERPRLIFVGFAVAAAVSLLAGIPATRAFGLTGAIWGVNVSDLSAFLLLLIAVARIRRQGGARNSGLAVPVSYSQKQSA